MVKNIIYIVILAVIGVPSWQIGTVILEKKNIGYMLQEQANSIKRHHHYPDLVKEDLEKNLDLMGLPTAFSLEVLGRKKIKISYKYYGDATVFGYTYYDTKVDMEVITEDGTWD